ncbi:hypothetical protein EBR43_02365 [bacterium]|jgi:secreted Zn-dependent insulinase-like peptidase|nr:hypothetical protein [bacterium]NBW56631.1 hypothetical protein [bacterium]NBX71605.1 hypothetical protein [bacterium]
MQIFIKYLLFVIGISFCYTEDILLTPNDERHAFYTVLSNGIPVIAIEDHQSQSGVVAFYHRGSLENPKNYPGLAHFLEHMIFIKNEQDHDIDPLIKLAKHYHGYANAYTSLNETVYTVELEPAGLPALIQKISASLTQPVFDKNYIDREISAVNSEWEIGKNHTYRVAYDLLFQHLNPQHPVSAFHIGNRATLLHETNDQTYIKSLVDFYKKNYGHKTLTLGVYGPYSTEQMIGWLESAIGSYQHEVAAPLKYDHIPLYEPQRSNTKFIQFVPRKQQFITTIAIPIEQVGDHRLQFEYLCEYLSRQDEYSLVALLKEKNLAINLGASFDTLDQQGLFTITCQHQAPLGDKTQDLLNIIYGYLTYSLKEIDANFIKIQENILKRIWETSRPTTNYTGLVNGIHALKTQEPKNILIEPYLNIQKYQHLVLNKINNDLLSAPRWIVCQSVESLETKYPQQSRYDAPYAVGRIKVATDLEFPFHSMKPALYDTKDLSVISTENMQAPLLLEPNVYFWSNHSFNQPIALLTVKSEKSFDERRRLKESFAVTVLYAQLADINEQFNNAGFFLSLHPKNDFLLMSASGYRSNFMQLYQDYWKILTTTRLQEKYFLEYKKILIDKINNDIYQSSQAVISRLFEHSDHDLSLEDSLALIEDIDLAAAQEALDTLLIAATPEIFLAGNLTQQEATSWIVDIKKPFMNHQSIDIHPTKHKFQSGLNKQATYSYTAPQSVVLKSFMFEFEDDRSIEFDAQASLIEALLSGPAFEELRTQQQIGYIVKFGKNAVLDRHRTMLSFMLVSDKFNSQEIINHIELFEEKIPFILQQIGEDQFNEIKKSLIKKILIPDGSLSEAYAKHNINFIYMNHDFSYQEKLIKALEQQTFEKIVALIRNIFDDHKDASVYTISLIPDRAPHP